MTISRTKLMGKVVTCRAIDTKRDDRGRVRDYQCHRVTSTSVHGIPLCTEHRRMTSLLIVVDDTGNIIPFSDKETQA